MVPRSWRKIRYRYDLRGSFCESCGNYHYPPRNFCPTCRRKGKPVEAILPDEGRIVSYTVVREKELYVVALIELDNGTRILSQVSCDHSKIKIGMRVKKAFRRYGEDGEDGIIHYGTKFVPVD